MLHTFQALSDLETGIMLRPWSILWSRVRSCYLLLPLSVPPDRAFPAAGLFPCSIRLFGLSRYLDT